MDKCMPLATHVSRFASSSFLLLYCASCLADHTAGGNLRPLSRREHAALCTFLKQRSDARAERFCKLFTASGCVEFTMTCDFLTFSLRRRP